MVWAVKNGMVGVNMQRHPGQAWDDPAKAIGMIVQWVNQNIAGHKGNRRRVFIWTQSAGNIPASTYIGHSDLWGPKGVGVKGVISCLPRPSTFCRPLRLRCRGAAEDSDNAVSLPVTLPPNRSRPMALDAAGVDAAREADGGPGRAPVDPAVATGSIQPARAHQLQSAFYGLGCGARSAEHYRVRGDLES